MSELETCEAKSHGFADTLNACRYLEFTCLVILHHIQHSLIRLIVDERKMSASGSSYHNSFLILFKVLMCRYG